MTPEDTKTADTDGLDTLAKTLLIDEDPALFGDPDAKEPATKDDPPEKEPSEEAKDDKVDDEPEQVEDKTEDPPATEDDAKAESEKKDDAKETAEDDLDLGFKSDEEDGKEKDESFDEAAFDAETELNAPTEKASRAAFKKLRAELKEYKKGEKSSGKEAELATQVEDLKKEAARVAELEQQVKDLAASDYQVKLESTPEFQAEIQRPVDRIKALIKQVSDEYKIDPATIVKAVNSKSMREQVRILDSLEPGTEDDDELPASVKSRLQDAASQYQDIEERHAEMLADAKTKYAEIEEKRLAEAQKENARRGELHREQVAVLNKDLAARHPDLFGEDGKHAERLQADIARAMGMTPDAMSVQNGAYAAWSGAVAPVLVKALNEAREELRELRKGKDAEQKASPNLSDGVIPEDAPGDDEEEADFETLMAKAAAKW